MNPFSTRALIALFSVGLVTFFLGLLLAAFGGDLFGERSAGHDSYSRSLVGHHGLAAFLEESGLAVVVSRRPADLPMKSDFPLLLLEPVPSKGGYVPDPQKDRSGRILETMQFALSLSRAKKAGIPVVIALPKRSFWKDQRSPRWIAGETLLPEAGVDSILRLAVLGAQASWTGDEQDEPYPAFRIKRCASLNEVRAEGLGLPHPEVDLGNDAQVFDASGLVKPLLECREGVIVGRAASADERILLYIISDPDLFNNRGLARGDHALVMHALIKDVLGAKGVVIDEAVHGFVSKGSLMALAMSFPLVVIVIHGLIALGIAIWAASARFGKAMPPPPELPPGKELLIDNTSKLLLQGKDHVYALRRYLKITMADVARRYLLMEGTSQKDLLPRLIRLSKIRGIPLDLNRMAKAARDRDLGQGEALRLARKIHAWQESLMGTGKREL